MPGAWGRQPSFQRVLGRGIWGQEVRKKDYFTCLFSVGGSIFLTKLAGAGEKAGFFGFSCAKIGLEKLWSFIHRCGY